PVSVQRVPLSVPEYVTVPPLTVSEIVGTAPGYIGSAAALSVDSASLRPVSARVSAAWSELDRPDSPRFDVVWYAIEAPPTASVPQHVTARTSAVPFSAARRHRNRLTMPLNTRTNSSDPDAAETTAAIRIEFAA